MNIHVIALLGNTIQIIEGLGNQDSSNQGSTAKAQSSRLQLGWHLELTSRTELEAEHK